MSELKAFAKLCFGIWMLMVGTSMVTDPLMADSVIHGLIVWFIVGAWFGWTLATQDE